MRMTRLAAALLSALVFCAPASAQNSKWNEPYQRGLKAFEAGKYAEAVPLFERAIAADPRAQVNKTIEGVFRVDYIPYYYLALAYVELQQFDKAQQNLDKARSPLTRQQQARFAAAETKIKVALAPKPPQRNAEFDAGVREADTLLAAKQFDAAIKKLDQLRTIDAAEYAGAGLAARRDEAAKGLAGQLTEEARAAVQAARLKDADARLRQADQLTPGQKPVADLLAEIQKRQDDYKRLKTAAQADVAAHSYAAARDKFKEAQAADPEQFASDDLGNRLNEVTRLVTTSVVPPPPAKTELKTPVIDPSVAEGQRLADSARQYVAEGNYLRAQSSYAAALRADPRNQEALAAVDRLQKFNALRDGATELTKAKNVAAAQKMLVDARNLDATRFIHEGLTSVLDRLATAGGESPSRLALQEGLLALFRGDAQKSITILEPVSARGDKTAPLHAYLGVAYATRALSTPNADEQGILREKASEQFKLAVAAEPGYRLSPRIVSPTIIALYEQAQR